jgi:histidinol-phosphate aminotransferase
MGLANKLAAPQIKELVAYQSARRIGGVGNNYLNANESPYPAYQMPEKESWQRYPDFLPGDLTTKYGLYSGISGEYVLTTRGADEGIDLLIRAFCEPNKDSIAINTPTYAMYDFIAEAHQVAITRVSLTAEQFALDVAAYDALAEQPKIVFLCHPNNPTGNLLTRKDVLVLAEKYADEAFVVVDEAYIEFSPNDSFAAEIAATPNLIVLRTLSKAFSLAAVRIGFVLANPDVIELLAKLIAPYPIPDPCARIALNALSDMGVSYMEAQRDRILSNKKEVEKKLKLLSCVEHVHSSATNFLLVKFEDSAKTFSYLVENGIILRDQAKQPGLENHLRITIGDDTDMQQMLDCLALMK